MKRVAFHHLLVVFLPLWLMVGCGEAADSRPNFVILIADDLGWEDVGSYGNGDVYTPHIDQLAAGGMQFNGAFLTTASCSASRGSILTGKYPHTNGLVALHQPLPASQRTIAHYLGAAGYFTASSGKWHLGPNAVADFDLVIKDRPDPEADVWMEALRSRPRDQPFFFWLASRDPHPPHDGGREFIDHYRKTPALPSGFVDGPGVRQELLDYYLEISRFDSDVGLVITELERQGVLENTLVMVMSDNGRAFPRGKLTLYDGGIKTPLIVSWPAGLKDPGQYDHLVSAVDIAPTLLNLAGVDVPEDLQGISFSAVFRDRGIIVRDHIFAERNWHVLDAHERAVRTEQFLYKENRYPEQGDCRRNQFASTLAYQALLAAYYRKELDQQQMACFDKRRRRVELYAVSPKGVDFTNLGRDPRFADVKMELKRKLNAWRRSTGDFDFHPYQPPPGEQ